MPTLKERLQARADVSQVIVKLELIDEEVTIRRLLVSERNALMQRFKMGLKGVEPVTEPNGVTYPIAIVACSTVPPLTEEDVLELPAAVADELAQKIMEFNGWSERGRKELADQFRATARPTV